jgi:hypothetical protein
MNDGKDPLAPPEPDELEEELADLAMAMRSPDASPPLVMADVVCQIQAIADLAEGARDPALVEACRRAQSLLARLRNQFLFEVAGPGSPAGVTLVDASEHPTVEAAAAIDAA